MTGVKRFHLEFLVCSISGACTVRPIDNGWAVNATEQNKIMHGASLQYACNRSYELDYRRLPKCHNGSWDFLPVCKPGKDSHHIADN